MIFSFTGYEVDTDRIEVRRDGKVVHVEPQVFDVLCYLIRHRDRVISKIELFEQVWGGAFVGESTLTSRIKTARRLVGDDGQTQGVIRTVHRRGYQFVADVVEHDAVAPGETPSPASPPGRPSGTVSFLFTDIEGSSRLWEQYPELMGQVVEKHDRIVRDGIVGNRGAVFATAGDSFAAAFTRATDAVAAARDVRAGLDAAAWPEPIVLRVRLGVHSGETLERDGDYFGAAVNRAARVMGVAHGGQTLVSDVTAGLLADSGGLIDLGACRIDPSMPMMRIWQVDGPAFPPINGSASAALPSLRTELIGRDADLERVADAVAEHGLVSVVGPGGAGKTTLALAAAKSLLVSFASGVIFVELASVDDGGGVVRAVAEAAGVEGAAGLDARSLSAHLARRPALLVLDNCEHLVDECADFADELLDADSQLAVLTTSREPLGVEGEVVLPLGSLNVHAPELFVARARAVRADIDLDPDDERIVALCQQLDGLPLAIELSAAQLSHLRLDDLIARVDAFLELPGRGRTRGRDRHVTLERTIAWSYDLIDEPRRWLLRQFGIFPGSFDLEAAEAVGARNDAGPVTGLLSDLVVKNLLTWVPETGRYRLLETIRAFASQRLVETDELESAAERLRSHVVARAVASTRLERWLSGDHAATVRADLDNQRFAFERSMWSGRVRDALEIHVGCSYLFRNTTSCADGRRWDARLETVADELDPSDHLWSLLIRGDVAQGTADHELGHRAARAAIDLARAVDDDAALAIARHFDALHHVVAEPDVARSKLGEIIELARSVDGRLVQLMEAYLAVTEMSAGAVDLGTELSERVGHEVSGGGYEVFIANWAAWTAALINRDAQRLRYWRERQGDHLSRVGVPEPWLFLWSTALVTAMEGDDPTDGLRRALERADAEGHAVALDVVLALSIVEYLAGHHRQAAESLGLAASGRLNNLSHYVLVRSLRAQLGNELGTDAVREAMSAGRTLDVDDVFARHGLVASASVE